MITTPTHWPSPAKLNLFLYITGRRDNGYHELQTLFQFVDFGDELTVTANKKTSAITITPEIPGVALEDNLIWKAATALQQYTSTSFGADIELKKVLPMGGGIGGNPTFNPTTKKVSRVTFSSISVFDCIKFLAELIKCCTFCIEIVYSPAL